MDHCKWCGAAIADFDAELELYIELLHEELDDEDWPFPATYQSYPDYDLCGKCAARLFIEEYVATRCGGGYDDDDGKEDHTYDYLLPESEQ